MYSCPCGGGLRRTARHFKHRHGRFILNFSVVSGRVAGRRYSCSSQFEFIWETRILSLIVSVPVIVCVKDNNLVTYVQLSRSAFHSVPCVCVCVRPCGWCLFFNPNEQIAGLRIRIIILMRKLAFLTESAARQRGRQRLKLLFRHVLHIDVLHKAVLSYNSKFLVYDALLFLLTFFFFFFLAGFIWPFESVCMSLMDFTMSLMVILLCRTVQ